MAINLSTTFREKYLDESRSTAAWFIFGKNPKTGEVDIADQNGDVFTNVKPELADRIIEAREKFLNELHSLIL